MSHSRYLSAAFGVAIAPVAIIMGQPARAALDVAIKPTAPKLGDTISILIQSSGPLQETPIVTVGDKTYPSFAIAPNRFRSFIPTTPLEVSGRRVVRVSSPGETTRNLAVFVKARSFPTQSIWLPPGKSGNIGTDFEFDRVDAFKQLITPQKFWNNAFLRPTRGPISTIFGVRRYYNGEFAHNYYHRGIDYAAGIGTPVVAPAAGRISLVGTVAQGFKLHGNTVGLDHGQGVLSIFIHLNRINVQEGQYVQPGQVIGTVGSTGASTGPHLHWGLYVNGQAVDPVPWRYQRIE